MSNMINPKVSKYFDFSAQIQNLINSRVLSSTELHGYYDLIENYGIEANALVRIIQYCVETKGTKVNNAYINTIALDWISEGCLTVEDINNKIELINSTYGLVNKVLNNLNTRRYVFKEDIELFNNWTKVLSFDIDTILKVAKNMATKKVVHIKALDNQLHKYHKLNLKTFKDIENYESDKQRLFLITKIIVKNLGLYYEDLSKVVETYSRKWDDMGFNEEMLLILSDYAFKNSVRTLESFDKLIAETNNLGLRDKFELEQHLENLANINFKIEEIFTLLGITRNVNSYDRKCYNTWKQIWCFSDDIISYAVSLSAGKINAIQYLNKILSNWHDKNVTTLEQAQDTSAVEDKIIKTNTISQEQIKELFSNLEYVEV